MALDLISFLLSFYNVNPILRPNHLEQGWFNRYQYHFAILKQQKRGMMIVPDYRYKRDLLIFWFWWEQPVALAHSVIEHWPWRSSRLCRSWQQPPPPAPRCRGSWRRRSCVFLHCILVTTLYKWSHLDWSVISIPFPYHKAKTILF